MCYLYYGYDMYAAPTKGFFIRAASARLCICCTVLFTYSATTGRTPASLEWMRTASFRGTKQLHT